MVSRRSFAAAFGALVCARAAALTPPRRGAQGSTGRAWCGPQRVHHSVGARFCAKITNAMSDERSRKNTAVAMDRYHGSPVFEKAAFTIGLDDFVSRRLLWESAAAALTDPWKLTIDDLGLLLPEVERRLRLLVPGDEASEAFARVRSFVINWEE
jgi:hypothetical protein